MTQIMEDSAALVALRQRALDEIKHQRRKLNQEQKDFQSRFGPQDPKPMADLLKFEALSNDLDLAEARASKYDRNADGSVSCPICITRGKNNILSGDIRNDGVHCAICGFVAPAGG